MALRAASDAGRPIAALAPEGEIGQIYQKLAARLRESLATLGRRDAPRQGEPG
jgi:hypothetical protein